jgi:hypothetical protein
MIELQRAGFGAPVAAVVDERAAALVALVDCARCGLASITADGRSYAYRYQNQRSTLYVLEGLER